MVPKICTFPECGRTDKVVRGLCATHYRQRNEGRPLTPIQPRNKLAAQCAFESCSRTPRAKNLCQGHYTQLRKGQELKELARTTLSEIERFAAKVEKTETCWNWVGSKAKTGYGKFKFRGGLHYAHRASYIIHIGKIPDGLFIDHRCHNRSCVNPDHLRLATNKQNSENLRGLKANNSTGARGVYWHKQKNLWFGAVKHNKKLIYVLSSKDRDKVEQAVIAKRNELFTHNDLDRR